MTERHESSQLSAESPAPAASRPRPRWWQRRVTKVLGSLLALMLVVLVVAAEFLLHHLEPIVRERLIQTLSQSFNSPVELDALHISLFHGIEVQGDGLRVPYGYTPNGSAHAPAGPLLSIQRFRFRTTVGALLHHTTHLEEFTATGVEIHIPPHDLRGTSIGSLFGTPEGKLPADPAHPRAHPRIAFTVDHLVNEDVKLFIETDQPGKEALEFDIRRLDLRNVGPDQSALYTADLVNAKPKGDVHADGHFGPWASEQPRETPIDGDYTFDNADLGTIRGIGGTLHSVGHFSGQLDRLVMDGTADVPNFFLDTAHHPVPLHAKFHAFVDGTTGDTTLAPVQARLLHSDVTTTGKIVKVPGKGHDIALEVNVPAAQVADFLELSVKTTPPLMNGTLSMKARLHIPPGPERVPFKMEVAGHFGIRSVRFNNLKFQNRVDGLSARATGHPEEAKSVSKDRVAEAESQMSADFVLQHGLLTAADVHYSVPGAAALLNGVYSMDGNVFEFKGHVRTEATASQMVGGWKGLLLAPIDRFLKKDGAGTELPVEISGTEGDVHFGLAMDGADESSKSMAQDLRKERHAQTPPPSPPKRSRDFPGPQL